MLKEHPHEVGSNLNSSVNRSSPRQCILSLSAKEASEFFLKGKSYCNFDLPIYFNFTNLILSISSALSGQKLKAIQRIEPKALENVNYKLINNKDGKFSWRPFTLIHPVIYVFLVQNITEEKNWSTMAQRFKEFASEDKIECVSLPVISTNENVSDKAEMVMQWWHEAEQKSLELALDYEYLIQTDITDCYGSLYTHSIPWAIHGKEIAKKDRNHRLIGNAIDHHLQAMSYGQTNGIPQGSALMDFIAEIVLGYGDMLLAEKIKEITNYRIIRYRDDYRIFVNNPKDGEEILKSLTEVLIDLGMKLSPQKTSYSDDVIEGSIKPDKLYWLSTIRSANSLQKSLLLIHMLAKKHPNSGRLATALTKFRHRIEQSNLKNENIAVLISITVDIAYRNPRTYPIASSIISKLMSFAPNSNAAQSYITKIRRKFSHLPNNGLLELWLQRMTHKESPDTHYEEKLCKLVKGEDVHIWESDWLPKKFAQLVNCKSIIDPQKLREITPVIPTEEISLFSY